MRDTYLQAVGKVAYDWTPVSRIPTNELHAWLGDIAGGEVEAAPDSPNNGKTNEDIRDRILIELRARELGLV